MPQIPLKLPVASVIGRDGEVATARLINGYAESIERDGKAEYVIYGAPGLTRWDQGSYTGAERGMIPLDDFNLIAVLGNQVVKFDVNGRDTLIGTITGSDRVILAKDRENPNSIAIVTTDGQYYLVTGGNTVAKVANANLPSPNSVTYLSGHFLYSIPDGRVFCSAIDDGATISAAAFDTANANPDQNVRAYAYSGYLYVFGTQSTEVWQADTSLANQPFPYSPIKQTISLGLLAAQSLAESDDGLIWVDSSGIVRQNNYFSFAGGPKRISTHTVERAISSLSPAAQKAIVGSVHKLDGHIAYVMSSPNWTWVYDATASDKFQTPVWYERKSYGMPNWRAGPAVQFNGLYICGDRNTGKLYSIDPSNATEDGNVHEMEVWCGVSHRFPGQMIVDNLKIDVIGGVGLQTGNLADTDPVLLIDFSDNGGKTFEGEMPESLGMIGRYGTTVESYMWGLVREKGRIWRFRVSINAVKGIIQAFLNARPARG